MECLNCGSTEFGEGVLTGYANLMPKGKIMSNGSKIIVKLCTHCGEVSSMKVEKPEKFK